MMTVRFPSGFSIRYNTATYAQRCAWGYTDLYDKKDGNWIAQVPNTALIEVVPACCTYNPVATDSDQVKAAHDLAQKEIRALGRKIAKLTKEGRR